MQTISSQLKALRKLINIPYQIRYVDDVVLEKDWEDKVIYIHIDI